MILIYIFILINLFIKPTNYLGCGIFVWNGQFPSTFSIPKFKLLGMFNDTRGGDSCGVFANENIDKGINTISKFKDFWKEYDFNSTKGAKVIIGHARKASVGTISHENAQPIGFTFKSNKQGKKGIVLAHNGTLTNYEELAKKYNINTDDLSTDTQVLAQLLYFGGWKVLEEYEGSAALIIHLIHEPDTIYVFKGASKNWPAQVNNTEERPLFYYQENKNSIYLSSIEDSLVMLLDDPKTESSVATKKVKEVPENILFRIKNGIMTEVQKIDRSKIVSSKSYTYGNNNVKTYNNFNSFHQASKRNKFNDFDEDGYPNYGSQFDNEEDEDVVTANSVAGKIDPDRENLDNLLFGIEDYLYYVRCRYYLNKILADGSYFVSMTGRVYSTLEKAIAANPINQVRKLFFIKGILMKNKESYQKGLLITSSVKGSEFESYGPISLMAEHSVYPIHIICGPGWLMKKSSNKSLYYTGEFQPMFHNKVYKAEQGGLKSITTKFINGRTRDVFMPRFDSKIDVYVDEHSSSFSYDMEDLGSHEFDFESIGHRNSVLKNIKELANQELAKQALEKDKLKKRVDIKIINPKYSAETVGPKRTSFDKNLEDKIAKLKTDICNIVSEYQEDISDLNEEFDRDAMTMYNRCEKVLIDITNDLPF